MIIPVQSVWNIELKQQNTSKSYKKISKLKIKMRTFQNTFALLQILFSKLDSILLFYMEF